MAFSTNKIEPILKLYPYQMRWITDDSRYKIGCWARQTGKTFTTTLEIVNSCFDAISEGKKQRWVILSRGERQAKEAMDEGVKLHSKAYGMAFESISYDYEGTEGKYRALEVEYPNGTKITALPANPDTARGFSANVFLDEFAFHADSRKIWAALFPVISRQNLKLRITSTPNGKSNKFYDLMTSDSGIWSKHSTNIYQAVLDGLQRNPQEMKIALNDEDAWEQEFECRWLDEASAWLSYDIINSCEDSKASSTGSPNLYTGDPVFIGIDIARRRDLWVAWVLEQIGDVFWTREVRTLRRATFREQDEVIDELFRKYRVAKCCIDQTGMGEKVVEDVQLRYGQIRVEGLLFTNTNKYLLATVGKQTFEDKKIRIPMGDADIREDLHKLKKEVTPSGTIRFIADSDESGHADRAWACFLALYAAQNSYRIEYKPLNNIRKSYLIRGKW